MNPTREATARWKAFLESTPPNTGTTIPELAGKYAGSVSGHWFEITCPSLQLHCGVDDGLRWFQCSVEKVNPGYVYLSYSCRNCSRSVKTFAVLIVIKPESDGDVDVMKLGEFPPFAAPTPKRIEKLLTPQDLELYRK